MCKLVNCLKTGNNLRKYGKYAVFKLIMNKYYKILKQKCRCILYRYSVIRGH